MDKKKIKKIMNKGLKAAKKESEFSVVAVTLVVTAIFTWYFLLGGAMWVEWRNNLMAPLDCIQVLNEGMLHSEAGVTPKKCQQLKDRNVLEYNYDSEIWVISEEGEK